MWKGVTLGPTVAMRHLVMTLRPGPFVNSLCKKPTSDFDDLRCRAAKFMQLEELTSTTNNCEMKHLDQRRAQKGMSKKKKNAH